jgi:hypothetical protein
MNFQYAFTNCEKSFLGTFTRNQILISEERLCMSNMDYYYLILSTLQRTNTENWKQIFPEKELNGQSPNFYIHMALSDLYTPTIDPPILLL